jgi:hypothetical protein
MSQPHDPKDPTSSDRATDDLSWTEFEDRLADALGRIEPETFLIIAVPVADATGSVDPSGRYVQFANGGRQGFRAEASGNHYLGDADALTREDEERLAGLGWQWPMTSGDIGRNFSREWPNPAPWPEVAALAVRTLRDAFGVTSPGALRYQHEGFPAFRGRPTRLDLGIPAERVRRPLPATPSTTSFGAMAAFLELALRRFLGQEELVRDEDGDIPVRVGSAIMFVRPVNGAPPLIQLFAPILAEVDESPELLQAINEINSRILFGRLFWTHRGVVVAMELTGVGLAAEQVAFACVQLGNLADHLDDELRDRFGPPPQRKGPRPLLN